jgi:hypothetical protein
MIVERFEVAERFEVVEKFEAVPGSGLRYS